MEYIKIAGAATLTGAGLGCLAAAGVLRQSARVDLALITRTMRVVSG